MLDQVLAAAVVIGPVAAVIGAFAWWQAEVLFMVDPDDAARLRAMRRQGAALSAGVTLALGVVAAVVYALLKDRWPDSAPLVYVLLGIGLAVATSVAAAAVRGSEGAGGIRESIVVNWILGLGYGLLLPWVVGGLT
jgi:hypothetical protein